MDNEKFGAILPIIAAAIVDKIMIDSHLEEDEAVEKLYVSELYAVLENEKTKLWHCSVPMLYELYKSESMTGKLELPEY